MANVLSSVNLWLRVWLRAAQTERGNARRGATKKREISRTLLSINLHFSVDKGAHLVMARAQTSS